VTDGHLVIREARDDADLATLAAITVAVTPDEPNSLDNLRWADATYPGATRLLAELDGRAVGAATVGRIYVLPADFDGFWATIVVLPDARRRGIGGALLASVSDRARAAGKHALHLPASEGRPEGIAFLTRRGFVEYERSKVVRLELDGLEPPAVEPPAGVSLTTLAARPDLVEGVHAVAVEAFADIPGGDEPTAAGDLAEFVARDVERPSIPQDAFFVAVDDATEGVVGYASLLLLPGRSDAAWHDMTAVVRAWRGRGLALALKHATIGWAIANGLTELVTGNDIHNAPMRAVNARLGYRPTPDRLVMRGPLFDGKMDG
jgi:mycothiol synthase